MPFDTVSPSKRIHKHKDSRLPPPPPLKMHTNITPQQPFGLCAWGRDFREDKWRAPMPMMQKKKKRKRRQLFHTGSLGDHPQRVQKSHAHQPLSTGSSSHQLPGGQKRPNPPVTTPRRPQQKGGPPGSHKQAASTGCSGYRLAGGQNEGPHRPGKAVNGRQRPLGTGSGGEAHAFAQLTLLNSCSLARSLF